MAEDNPIEGLDPNQSAFEPMLDMMNQDIPGDLSRTTTTTTLYISGDQTQIDQPRVSTTTTMAPVEPLDIVSQFRQSNPDVRVGDVNKVIPNASHEERMQLLFDYPDQFGADIEYNNKINSYVTQLKDKGYKDDQILSYLEQQKEGKKSELMKNFPDLFDAKSINRKDNVIKALESDNISYSRLLKFGSESKLKNEYPELANLIDQKKKNDQIKKDIKAQENKVESDIDREIKDLERQLETGKNFIGQDMSPIDQEDARKRLREIEGEQTLADLDASDPFQGDTSRRDIGKISYKQKPVTGFEFKRINQFNVDPIVKDARFVDQDRIDQELLFLDELNKNIRSTGGTSLSDEQIREVYVDGTKPFNEGYKEYDDQLWKSVSGIISTDPVVDLNDEFFERHNTTRDEFINKRKLILGSGLFNTQKLGETYYTEEEFKSMYDRASQRMVNEYGSTIGTYEKITGTNLRENPEQFYDETRKSSSLYTSDIDEDIVTGNSEQTSKNLRKRFGFLPYGSKDEAENYLETEGFRFSYDGDNLVIQSTITPEGKSSSELVNGIEINMNGSDVHAKIKNFMSKAIITDDIKSVMNEYERGEGRFKGKFNDPMRASIDLSNYILSKPHVFGDANGFATDGYGQGFLFGLIPMGGGKSKSDFMMDMSIINTQINALKEKDPIGNKYLIDQLNKNIQYAQYINEEKAPELVGLKGHALAALSGVTETLSGVTEGALDLIIDIPFIPVSNSLSDDEVNMLKEKGLEEYQIADIQNKRIKDEVEYGIDEWLKNTTAVTDKSLADAGLTYELMKTMIHSVSTGLIVGFNPSLVPVAFGLQTTARVENELKDSGLSNFEKRVISWPMATFEGILENFGLQTALSPGKSMLFKWVANKALKGLPKNASLHAIEASMKYTMKGLGARTMLGILEGGSFEALTEVGQEAVEFTEMNIVNMLLDKEVFKNMPDITTEKGAKQFLDQLGKAAVLGFGAGSGISTISGTTNLLSNGFKLKGLNKSFDNQYNIITSEEGRAIALAQINLAYQSKQITKEEANARIKAMNDAYPLMMEIPAELSSGQKRQSYDLMLERKVLEAEVKDKDKNLVVKQTDRIAEINDQLQQISKTDAIQESETKEEVLPDEQSEMGLQDVGQRDTQGEEAAEVQKEEEVVDEAATKEYVNELEETKQSDPEQYWTVSSVSLEDAKKGTVVSVEGGKGVVGPDGDIKGVFKSKGSNAENVADKILEEAVKKGGTKLDNFDNYLTRIYKRNGFRVVSRTPFNEEFAPDGWSKEKHGTPDVVAMVYDPESKIDLQEKTFDNPETGYDDMIAYRDSFIKAPVAETVVEEEVIEDLTPQAAENIKNIEKQIDNAKISISSVLPGVEIVTHSTEDSYRKATDEADSKKQASRGEYNPKTNKIHINISKANNRTVAHEVFHAVLLDKVKTDSAAKDLTNRMVKSLSKNLEGMPEVKEALDVFAANYDENIQSEEKLAELVGILAGNYAQMNKPSQSLIKRFLDRLAKMFGLKTFTDGEVVDLLNTIAGKVAVGAEISDVDLKVIPKNKTAEIKEANKRFQADFTDLKSGVTYSFDKNTNEFKKIEQKYITRNKSISDFNNVFMILHQPDSAFSGKISKKLSDGSEILVEGKGGIFYPIKFHEKGYFWASTSKAAQAMAESMNKAINKDGKIYMALTTAPTNKVLSSTNAANGVMNLFISLSKNPKFKITGIESILIKSYDKAFGNKIDSSNNLDEIVKIIEEKLGAEKSSFDDRKTFSTSIIDSVVKSIQRKKSNQDAQNSLADFFGEGMMAEDLVTKFKKGSKISKANLTEAVSQMLTEPMLRDGKSKTENGSIYAILEIDGEVEAVDAKSETDHESYPKAIKSKGDSKTTLHLLTDRVKWNNVTIDPATGKTVNKSGKVKSKDPKKKGTLVERWTQIMSPSAGITTQGVKIDTSEVTTPAKRKQLVAPNGKPSNLNQEQYDLVRTPAFKNWFGDWQNDPKNASKVVDENGEPMVVYHGSTVPDIEVFDRSKSGRERSGLKEMGIYFSTNQELSNIYANAERSKDYDREVRTEIYQLKQARNKVRNNREYDAINKRIELLEKGKVYPVFLNIRDMVTFDAKFDSNAEAWNDLKVKASYKTATGRDAMEFLSPQVSKERGLERFGVKPVDGIKAKNIVEASYSYREGGYNVIPQITEKVKNTQDYKDFVKKYGGDAFLLFDGQPQNIKLADGSNKTFDPQEPSIRKQKDDGPVEPRIDIRNLKKKSDKKVKETNKGKGPILRRLRRGLFDRQNDIKRIVKDFIPDPKRISKIINAIVTKAGASGYANEIFTQQDEKIFKKKNRLGKMVNLSAEEMTNLEAIIYARRIVAINENRRERGMNPYTGMDGLTEQDAIDNLNMMESLVGKKEFDSLSERAEDYFEAFKNNLKMLRDSGRITEETYNNLKDVEYSPIKTLKYIIPQDTMTDEDINNAVSTLGVNKKDIMKLSDMNENEILFDARFLLMMNTNIVVRRSFENKMLNEFSQGYESIDKAGKEALSDFIIEGPVKKVPPGFRKVEYFQDGVKKDLIMREDYARQLLDIKNQNNFLKGLGKMTGANILRFFATGGNPLFIVGNTAVDFANIAFFSDVYSAIKPLATVQLAYDFVKNFLRKTGSTNNYNKIKMEFMEHGGAMDFLSTDGLRMVHDMRLKNRILNKAQKVLAAYARFMSYVGETGEMSFRLAVYERVKKAEIKKFEKENDRSPNQQEMEDIMFEAAAQSRETIDFSQGGTWVKQMDQALPYFNAAMQGLRRPLDYARKNPVGFTSNVVQYAMMAAGMTATSLGTLLRAIGDDEEEKKKVQDILDSISMYEKANYHIIFTGNKDKDGNYEYVRIKKLPLISILGTATEQYTTKYFLKYKGIDYKIDDRSIKKSIEMSAPLDVLGPVVGDESVGQALGGIVKRNPLAAAWLTYTYNEDTFTGDKVFYEPKDKKVKPYAEGLYDEKVNDIYKVVAPALDMSPKRSQAAVEKLITSESTNPSISIFYALTNGLFDTEADAFKENSDTFDNGMRHFLDVVSKKMFRHTNPNLLRYKNQDRLEELEKRIDTDAYLTDKKIKKEIDKSINFKNFRGQGDEYYKEQEKMDELFKKYDIDTLDRNSYVSYAELRDLKGNQLFKEMSSILYEKNPKMMAARLYEMYGNDFDIEAEETLLNTFKVSKRNSKVLLRGEKFYNKYYLNKSQEEIDKFEETFGKIR